MPNRDKREPKQGKNRAITELKQDQNKAKIGPKILFQNGDKVTLRVNNSVYKHLLSIFTRRRLPVQHILYSSLCVFLGVRYVYGSLMERSGAKRSQTPPWSSALPDWSGCVWLVDNNISCYSLLCFATLLCAVFNWNFTVRFLQKTRKENDISFIRCEIRRGKISKYFVREKNIFCQENLRIWTSRIFAKLLRFAQKKIKWQKIVVRYEENLKKNEKVRKKVGNRLKVD